MKARASTVGRLGMKLAAVLVVALGVGFVGLNASLASARTAKPARFQGNAPGLVVCNFSAKVTFSPPLKSSGGGGTNGSAVKGKVSGCNPSDSSVTVTSAKVTGSFSSSPLSCTTLSTTGASANLNVVWKGDFNGTVGGVTSITGQTTGGMTYGGKAAFAPSTLSGGSITGSFPGSSSLTMNVPSDLGTLCASVKGIRKLTLTGSLVVGSTQGGGGGGGGSVAGHVTQIEGEGHFTGECNATHCGTYCAVLSSGSVECWGQGLFGQLGDGQQLVYDSTSPEPVVGVGGSGTLAGVSTLASSGPADQSYCALLASGEADCWGLNFGVAPTSVTGVGGVGLLTGAVSGVSGGDGGYCALLTSSSVDCWGNGNPTSAVSGLTGVASLASNYEGTYCAVLSSGGVECWGTGYFGEFGNGTSGSNSEIPTSVSAVGGGGPLSSVASVVGEPQDTGGFCAVLTTGDVDCWGTDSSGELGPNGGSDSCPDGFACSLTPVLVTGLSEVTLVASDGKGYCALLASGSVDCWGDNTDGELGNATTGGPDCLGICSATPVAVGGLPGASLLSSDGSSYCAVLSTGSVDCWGRNLDNELGSGRTAGPDTCGSNSCSLVPIQAAVGVTTGVTSDPIGYCALLTTGSVECWGSNSFGELGLGSKGTGAGTLSASPNRNLTSGEAITVTGSALSPSSPGIVLECNLAPNQPTVSLGGVVNTSVNVGCSGPSGGDIAVTGSDGSLSTAFDVLGGTVGPPCGPSDLASCPSTDSAGHSPASDAANYPCPPTPAQQAAGITCALQFGDASGDLVDAPILFSGES
jgi:alpha-tubulin suppressor-like RCC1 family protein